MIHEISQKGIRSNTWKMLPDLSHGVAINGEEAVSSVVKNEYWYLLVEWIWINPR